MSIHTATNKKYADTEFVIESILQSANREKNINNRREFTVNFSSLEFVKKAHE